jgi:hypothetical protein
VGLGSLCPLNPETFAGTRGYTDFSHLPPRADTGRRIKSVTKVFGTRNEEYEPKTWLCPGMFNSLSD